MNLTTDEIKRQIRIDIWPVEWLVNANTFRDGNINHRRDDGEYETRKILSVERLSEKYCAVKTSEGGTK